MRIKHVGILVVCSLTFGCEAKLERNQERIAQTRQALCGQSSGPSSNLTNTADATRSLDSRFVMIPRSAWEAALSAYPTPEDRAELQGKNSLREAAARAASIANDPFATGVFSQFGDCPEPGQFTYEDVLVVVDDQLIDPTTKNIYATQYFIAPVGLEGSSTWLVRDLHIAIEAPPNMSGGGRCCGPDLIAEQTSPGGGGVVPPGCTPGPNSYCAGWNTNVRPGGALNHDAMRTGAGRPLVPMQMFSSAGVPISLSFAGPLGGIAEGMYCDNVVPLCLESLVGQAGFPWGGWSAPLPHGNPNCAPEQNYGGTNVPPWCALAAGSSFTASGGDVIVVRPSGAGTVPSTCDGQCPECATAFAVTNTDVRPRQCWLSRTSGNDICDNDTLAEVQSYQNFLNNQINSATLGMCASPTDMSTKCGGCTQIAQGSGATASIFECARCTSSPNDPSKTNCDYYLANTSGIQVPPGVFQEPPPPADAAPRTTSFSAQPPTLQPVSLAPVLPCTAGCNQSGRTTVMPSSAPRVGGAAQTADGPISVNAGEVSDDDNNSAINNKAKDAAEQQPVANDGDPVTLSNGALVLGTTDLSFPGSGRSLEFRRYYSSRTNIRTELGSNWSHNFATRLVPLKKQNMPEWVDPYCMGTANLTTCVMVVSGESSQLFYLDQATGMYMPQAGSMSTVRMNVNASNPAATGWTLREPDGAMLIFDRHGYVVRDTDRFGNSLTFEYEMTPAGTVLEAVCPWVPWFRIDGAWNNVIGPTGVGVGTQGCVLLFGLTGLTDMPTLSSEVPTDAIFGTTSGQSASLTAARAEVIASQPTYGTPLPSGQGLKRVTQVTDPLGRKLDFYYFTSGPNVGLLERVRGPAGTGVEFSYASDPNAPTGLNERFLTGAKRTDGSSGSALIIPSESRGFEYQYAWQRSDQMPLDLAASDAAYTSYFEKIYNCGAMSKAPCSDRWVNVTQFAHIPTLVAQQRRRLYSEAADNITRVKVINYTTGPSHTESETRYARNVFDQNFDRALAQRWGGEVDSSLPSVSHPGAPTFTWDTTLPLATFEYAGSVPVASTSGAITGEETDAFLPTELRTRYSLETIPTASTTLQDSFNKGLLLERNSPVGVPSRQWSPAAIGVPQVLEATVREACGFHMLPQARAKLPGYKPSLDYFDLTLPTSELATPGVSFAQELKRSYLSCETLALAETYDVRHNDLASTWTKATNGEYVLESVTGRRKHTAANANRICQWVRYTDRDGDIHYRGLNFQGRPLVNAVKVVQGTTTRWLAAETLYNADGNVLAQRNTTSSEWYVSDGDTRYTYTEEQIPTGSLGSTRPSHWSKRGNVLRVWERPRGGTVADKVGAALVNSRGRYAEYAYEPFFNQVRLMIRGNVKADGTDEPLERTVTVFDYQEFDGTNPEFQQLLWTYHMWGAQLASIPAEDMQTYVFNFASIQSKLNIELFGIDINGDQSTTALGVPVLVRNEAGPNWSQREETFLSWTPSGAPAIIREPDGTATVMKYYTRLSPQTGAADLTASGSFETGKAGLLASVTRKRLTPWPASAGPLRASCASLPSQYRFLLTSCGSNVSTQLSALGLSAEAVDGIVNAPSDFSTFFNYNVLGHASGFKTFSGQRAVVTTDTDGRTRQTDTYPAGSSTRDSYSTDTFDAFMRRTRTARYSNGGTLLREVVRTFDNGDQLLTECAAAASNGCNANPINGVKKTFVYTREGELFRTIDGAGLIAQFTRDGRKWTTQQTLTSSNPTEPVRRVFTAYDDDGNVLATVSGVLEPLTETRTWDGLGRLKTRTDFHGRETQFEYSKQDVLVSQLMVGDTAGPTEFVADGFGRTSSITKNNIVVAAYDRLPGGQVYAVSASGRGKRFVTFDALGSPAWAENSVGDASVRTEVVAPSARRTISRIRQQGALTTGVLTHLDALGRATDSVESGGSLSRTTSFTYDLAGNLQQTVAADTAVTQADYDLLGRVVELREQRQWNTSVFETSNYEYESRGLLHSTRDPQQYLTIQQYNGFGEPSVQTGPASYSDTWTYDEHGRKRTHVVGGQVDLTYEYDSFGYLTNIMGANSTLATFGYDALGRLNYGFRENDGLRSALSSGDRSVVTERTYDDLNRTFTETTTVGAGTPRTLTSQWTFSNGTWQRNVTLPSGRNSVHAFDAEGREVQQYRVNGRTTDFTWLDDLLTNVTSDAVTLQTDFDQLAQPVAWTYGGSSNYLTSTVVRDRVGRIATSSIEFEGGTRSWRGFVYDALGRLSALRESSAFAASISPHQTTEAAGIATENVANNLGASRWAYTREQIGSLLSIQDSQNIQAPRFETPLNYTAPNGDPTARTAGHRLKDFQVGSSNRSAQHDDAGRLIADGDQQFVFDELQQLARVDDSHSNLKEGYLYDISGRLTARVDSSANLVETLIHDGVQMVESFDANGVNWSAAWGPGIDNLLSLTAGDEREIFTLRDGRANIVGWAEADKGTLVASAQYTPEGRGTYNDQSGTCVEADSIRCPKPLNFPFGFHSAYSSSTTGLVYFRNRWYSPEAAQWLTHDPLGFVDSFDLYAFNAFDMVNQRDPMGLVAGSIADNGGDDPNKKDKRNWEFGAHFDFSKGPGDTDGISFFLYCFGPACTGGRFDQSSTLGPSAPNAPATATPNLLPAPRYPFYQPNVCFDINHITNDEALALGPNSYVEYARQFKIIKGKEMVSHLQLERARQAVQKQSILEAAMLMLTVPLVRSFGAPTAPEVVGEEFASVVRARPPIQGPAPESTPTSQEVVVRDFGGNGIQRIGVIRTGSDGVAVALETRGAEGVQGISHGELGRKAFGPLQAGERRLSFTLDGNKALVSGGSTGFEPVASDLPQISKALQSIGAEGVVKVGSTRVTIPLP